MCVPKFIQIEQGKRAREEKSVQVKKLTESFYIALSFNTVGKRNH